MKKKVGIATVVLTGMTIISTPVFTSAESETQDEKAVPILLEETEEKADLISDNSSNQENVSDYGMAQGVITGIEKDGDVVTLIVEDKEKSLVTHFTLSEDVLAFSSATTDEIAHDTLKEDLQVEVYFDNTKPRIMIYPAVIEPELIIVHDGEEKGQVKVGKFDENLLSLDGELQLKLAEDTKLVSESKKTITKADLKDKELLVFYKMETKSLPAQTTPTKIVALDPLHDELEELVEKDHYMKNGTKMVPLRSIAEQLGNAVTWSKKTGLITVTKGNRNITLEIGNKEYGLNKAIHKLEHAPELKDKKTYVPREFFDLLLK
ncbi:copper amine oxidase N-terminal domain-containing protein [Ornithinibacillus scapharcae]|uniref:copper amine oxidase N-terminal domain-containing protein n=1 Tax=Ornithinibacillus scapharcae TaxID=1147159 RepID=UPI000225B9D2|nr:copper amine oxidase N-terminal domain-containing protein [Ornithinibacillus scapharcae]